MIIGANTNVRHRGVLFHVQTEDSGRSNPHVISHLYHQGTIVASEKTDYSDRLAAQDLEQEVRGLIEAQHKSMLRRLRAGNFDAVIAERLGPAATSAETPTPLPDEPSPPSPAAAMPEPAAARGFGDGIVSQKPLDEVILDYLARKARDRAGRSEGSGRKT
ncbi:MAG TPA: hypothetical protein VMW19_17610 [Myxococcota bacterium]|nr:hypothetical protein [Myxococcota bacterium]